MTQSTAAPVFPADAVVSCSDKQQAFIERLAAERDVPQGSRDWMTRRIAGGTFDGRAASRTIEHLLSLPKLPAAEPVAEGMYELDGHVFKVAPARTSGRVYGRLLVDAAAGEPLTTAGMGDEGDRPVVKARFEYDPTAMRTLRPEHRMSVERAEALSRWFTFCVRCAAHLTADDSIDAGMGPVCRTKV